MGGVVDEDINAAKLIDRTLDHRTAMGRILQVAGDQHRLASLLLDQFLDLFGVIMLVQIGDQNVGAFARIGNGDGAANAAVASGDDRFLAVQPFGSLVAGLTVIRPRLHPRRRSRHGLLLRRKWRLRIRLRHR